MGANADTGLVWGTNINGLTVTNQPPPSVTINGGTASPVVLLAVPVGEIRPLSTIECAATFAPSLARTANIQDNTLAGKVGQSLLANTFSGMYDTYKDFTRANGTVAAFGDLAVNGLRQGLPGGGNFSMGVSGVAQDKALKAAFQNLGKKQRGKQPRP